MPRSKSMREVLEALDWVRREMMQRGSPDFIRQRQLEGRVHQLASRLARNPSRTPAASAPAGEGTPRPAKKRAAR